MVKAVPGGLWPKIISHTGILPPIKVCDFLGLALRALRLAGYP